MAFDFKKSLIKVQGGRQYLPVSARIVWFREEHPDWGIETEPIVIDTEKQYAIFRARIYNADGKLMAMGTKMENVKGFPDYMEKAECVPLDTRILTAEGWKQHDELRLSEQVLAFNAEKDCLEWVPLLAVRRYQNAPVVRASNRKGFDVVCTPDHKWPVRYTAVCRGKKYDYRKMRETKHLTQADMMTVAAVAPSGNSHVTAEQAFIMGLLITDGCVRYSGKHIRAYLCQSKPEVVSRIRECLRNVPHREDVVPAHTRTFPTGRTYDCQQGYRWHLAASYLHDLHDAFGIVHETELTHVVACLSQPARAAMLEAMMLADGDKKGSFAQMPGRNDWVIDVWTLLCAMEGNMVCKATIRKSCGGVWVARKKKTRAVWASNVVVENNGTADVWCPQTPLGTWVARFGNDVVTVTGNTGSVGRALALCGFGTQFSPELDEASQGRYADSPQGGRGGYNGSNGGGYQSGGNRYGGSGAGGSGAGGSGAGGSGGPRFSEPPRELSAPREIPTPREIPAPRETPPARDIPAPRPQPAAEAPPARPAAPASAVDDDDEFEAMLAGSPAVAEDDPFGEEEAAPALPRPAEVRPRPAAAPAVDSANADGPPACAGCGKGLTKAQQTLSVRNYGEALCPGCQSSRKPAGAAR